LLLGVNLLQVGKPRDTAHNWERALTTNAGKLAGHNLYAVLLRGLQRQVSLAFRTNQIIEEFRFHFFLNSAIVIVR
jgi:hypothetical protein